MNAPEGLRPMKEAPEDATWVVLWYRDCFGNVYPVAAHFACDTSGDDQPPFSGWFRWTGYEGGGHTEVPDKPIGWTAIQGVRMRT